MEKTARRPSTDPAQEKLRQNKANWNKEVSALVNDLIHFKKMMNGWPSKFFKERTRITDPIPADPATIIGSLAGDFQELANRGNGIIQEQLNYSKNRRKRQPKQLNLPLKQPEGPATPAPEAAPPAPDLSKQLSLGLTASDQASAYYLISEGSNPLSRFFARLLSPGIGGSEAARIRKYRMSLLNATLQTFKDLKKLQSAIVGSGPQSIFVASKLLDKAENNWVFLSSGFRAFQETLPGGAPNTGGPINVPASLKGEVAPSAPQDLANLGMQPAMKVALEDIQRHANTFTGVPGMSDLIEIAKLFTVSSPNERVEIAPTLAKQYRAVLSQLSSIKKIPSQKSFADIVAMETKNQSATTASAQDQLQAVAQGFLGKIKHQLNPFDKTSSFRLDIYKMAEENKKLLNKIMDALEKGLDAQSLSPLMNEVGGNMLKIRTLIHGLTSTIRGQGYQPQFMGMLESGNLGEHGVNLSPDQKKNLDRMLKQKQLRDITKMYGK